MKRADRLRQLVERRRQTKTVIMAWPTWTLDTARVRAQLRDGEVTRVALPWCGAVVWCGRSGDLIIAAGAVGHASDQEIAAWIRARLAESEESGDSSPETQGPRGRVHR